MKWNVVVSEVVVWNPMETYVQIGEDGDALLSVKEC